MGEGHIEHVACYIYLIITNAIYLLHFSGAELCFLVLYIAIGFPFICIIPMHLQPLLAFETVLLIVSLVS